MKLFVFYGCGVVLSFAVSVSIVLRARRRQRVADEAEPLAYGSGFDAAVCAVCSLLWPLLALMGVAGGGLRLYDAVRRRVSR